MKKIFFLTFVELIGFLFLFTSLFGPIFLLKAIASEPPPKFVWTVPPSRWYFNFPQEVTVDGSGNVYVADTDNCRIQKLGTDGTF